MDFRQKSYQHPGLRIYISSLYVTVLMYYDSLITSPPHVKVETRLKNKARRRESYNNPPYIRHQRGDWRDANDKCQQALSSCRSGSTIHAASVQTSTVPDQF